jgi:hypothetical protein
MDWLRSLLQRNRDEDDVFREEFSEAVLFTANAETSIEVDDSALKYLTDAGSKWIGTSSKAGSLASGPHINAGTSLRPVFRVYDDSHSTFLHALGQDTSGLVSVSLLSRILALLDC